MKTRMNFLFTLLRRMVKALKHNKLLLIAFSLILLMPGKPFATTITYTYDNLNRLTKADYGNGTTEEYTYDAAGNRLTFVVKAPTISVSPGSPFNFATTDAWSSVTQQFTVTNTGTTDLVISSIYIIGINASEFSQTNDCALPLSNGSCTVTVMFKPTSGGPKNAGLDIISNDPNNPYALTQLNGYACAYDVSPQVSILGTAGGSGNEFVTATDGCPWIAVSNSGWVNITNGSAGTGSGGVDFSVTSNNSSSSRNGSMTIAGQTVIVTQMGTGCSYTITPTSRAFNAAGGEGSVNLTTQSGCTWTAEAGAPWINITSGGSGSGNGTITYSVAMNTGPVRSGLLAIGDKTLTVNQSGIIDPSCNNLPVRRTSVFLPVSAYTIQDAYNGTGDGGTIQAQALDFVEDLDFDREISVNLKGGYDCYYSPNNGQWSAIDGTLTISAGTVTIENIVIQ